MAKSTFGRREVRRITQLKQGSVFKTEPVRIIWLKLGLSYEREAEIAKEAGGDQLYTPPPAPDRDLWPKQFETDRDWFPEEGKS
jgi:hypothetical protein